MHQVEMYFLNDTILHLSGNNTSNVSINNLYSALTTVFIAGQVPIVIVLFNSNCYPRDGGV